MPFEPFLCRPGNVNPYVILLEKNAQAGNLAIDLPLKPKYSFWYYILDGERLDLFALPLTGTSLLSR